MGEQMNEEVRVYKLVKKEVRSIDKNADIVLTLLEELEKLIPNGKTRINLVKTVPQKQFYQINGTREAIRIQGVATEDLVNEKTLEVEVGDEYKIVIRRRW